MVFLQGVPERRDMEKQEQARAHLRVGIWCSEHSMQPKIIKLGTSLVGLEMAVQ